MNPGLFRFALLYPILYVPVLFGLAFNPSKDVAVTIVPLHLLAMSCMVYILYFVAKHFVMVETGKAASRSDRAVIGTFLLFWFFPLGVWFVQPQVNRLYESRLPGAPL